MTWLCASVLVGRVLAAQDSTATMQGRVIDRSTGRGVAATQIMLASNGRQTVSDSTGHYTFDGLPSGTSEFVVRAASFPIRHILVALDPGQRLERTIELDSTAAAHRGVQQLPPVPVVAPAPVEDYRLTDFERRRRTGRGQYLTDKEIRASLASNLQDLMRGLRGVDLECRGGFDCRIHMARAQRGCTPDYVVDDQLDNQFGPTTPIRDIQALEVYTGPSDVPGEYAGRSSGCGVIVIWTRSAPPKR